MSSAESGAAAFALDELDVAVGTALGLADVAPLVPAPRANPRAALEELTLGALRRPPCLVAFSGGRDSSVVLAIATAVARREGLPLPVPVTYRFPVVADSAESEWQELVIGHLGLPDWQRMSWAGELDVIGSYARRALRLVGPFAPANLHFLVPMFDLARGGSVVSGSGGDELFGLTARPALARLMFRPWSLRPHHLRWLPGEVTTRGRRRRQIANSDIVEFQWLNPEGRAAFLEAFADWMARARLRYDDALCDWLWRGKGVQHGLAVQRQLGASADVEVLNPFEHPHFLSHFAGATSALAPGGRGATYRRLAGELLPTHLLDRTSKAGFDGAFLGPTTRAFVDTWDRTGVTNRYVDAEALRREWTGGQVLPQSLVLLQLAAQPVAEAADRGPAGPTPAP